jgi:hypothetical protein
MPIKKWKMPIWKDNILYDSKYVMKKLENKWSVVTWNTLEAKEKG